MIELAPRGLVQLRNRLKSFLVHQKHLLRIAIQNLPGGRHQDLLPAAVKKLFPAFLLEQANLRADGRLRAKQFLRRPGETLQLRHLQKTS